MIKRLLLNSKQSKNKKQKQLQTLKQQLMLMLLLKQRPLQKQRQLRPRLMLKPKLRLLKRLKSTKSTKKSNHLNPKNIKMNINMLNNRKLNLVTLSLSIKIMESMIQCLFPTLMPMMETRKRLAKFNPRKILRLDLTFRTQSL